MDERYLYKTRASEELIEQDERIIVEDFGNYSVTVVENAVILPFKPGGTKSYGLGGVLSQNGDFVAASGDPAFGGLYSFEDDEIIDSEDSVLFLGYSIAHWGTFLVDLTRRLYYREMNQSIKVAFCGIGFDEGSFGAIRERCYEFFALIGMSESDLIDVRVPTRFKRVFVPELGFEFGERIIQEYMFPFRHARETVNRNTSKDPTPPKRIYLSRTSLARKKEVGERAIERLFEENGFSVIFPESLSVTEQIKLIANADIVVSLEGTIAHNILFGSAETKQIIIRKQSELNPRQQLFNKVVGNPVTYIDCYSEPFKHFPISHDDGPFLVLLNDNLVRFANDNSMKLRKGRTFRNAVTFMQYMLLCMWIGARVGAYRLLSSFELGKTLIGALKR